MEQILGALAQYGPLGLWTASLLWMNWQQRKEIKEDEERAAEALKYHQEQIMTQLSEQERMLERAIDKIDRGIEIMKSESPRGRILRLQQLSEDK